MWYNEDINKSSLQSNMTFKINSKVFYPAHGAGWIKGKNDIDFAGEIKSYYEFEFINNPLSISTPVDNVVKLKVREVHEPELIRKKLKALKKEPIIKPPTESYNEFINLIRGKDLTGEIDEFVTIIQYCNYIKSKREEDGRLIPTSIIKYTKNSIAYLIGELAVSADLSFEDSQKEFEKLTGINAD